jgi:isopenicillin-N N-acyltransferase-like protein
MDANSPFPVISVEGDAAACGEQYGSKCRELIRESLAVYQTAFQEDLKLDWDQAIALGQKFLPAIETYDPQGLIEMRAVARGAGRRFEEILVLHAKTELKLVSSLGGFEGCTTVAAMPEATLSHNTLAGKNWDWTATTQKLGVILRKKRTDGPSTVSLAEAGLLGRDGFNSAGICIVANALASDNWHVGVPLHVLIHKALRAETLQDAMGAILGADRASSNNYMIVYQEGEALCIEAAPNDYNVVWAKDGTLAHSNHFTIMNPRIKDFLPAMFPNTLTRYHRAGKLIGQERGRITVETFKKILTDHFDSPYSICWHSNPKVPSANQIQTNASMIFELKERRMHVAAAPPCRNEYVAIDCADIMPRQLGNPPTPSPILP